MQKQRLGEDLHDSETHEQAQTYLASEAYLDLPQYENGESRKKVVGNN